MLMYEGDEDARQNPVIMGRPRGSDPSETQVLVGVSNVSRNIILIHGDSDGVCSGALLHAYLRSKGASSEAYFTHPAGLLHDLYEFTRNGDNIYIADIALSEAHVDDIIDILRERSKYGEILYIDHHPEPLSVKTSSIPGVVVNDTCCSASELTYRFLSGEGLSEEYGRIALYGAIGDYLDHTRWVLEELDKWDRRSIYFEAGVVVQGLEGSRKMYDFKREVLKLLSSNTLPSENSELLLRAVVQSRRDEYLRQWIINNVTRYGNVSYVEDPPGSIGRAANYARVYGGGKIGLAFETRGDILVMSLRSMRGIDLNLLLRKITPSLGGTGGGHSFAAGARIPRRNFELFLKKINEYLDTSNK